MDALKRTQDDLGKGKQKLEDMLERLEREQVMTDQNKLILLVVHTSRHKQG